MLRNVNSDLMRVSAVESYVSPEVNVVLIYSEGVLCQSLSHGGFEDGGEYDL